MTPTLTPTPELHHPNHNVALGLIIVMAILFILPLVFGRRK